jgi:hypothetical protein
MIVSSALVNGAVRTEAKRKERSYSGNVAGVSFVLDM